MAFFSISSYLTTTTALLFFLLATAPSLLSAQRSDGSKDEIELVFLPADEGISSVLAHSDVNGFGFTVYDLSTVWTVAAKIAKTDSTGLYDPLTLQVTTIPGEHRQIYTYINNKGDDGSGQDSAPAGTTEVECSIRPHTTAICELPDLQVTFGPKEFGDIITFSVTEVFDGTIGIDNRNTNGEGSYVSTITPTPKPSRTPARTTTTSSPPPPPTTTPEEPSETEEEEPPPQRTGPAPTLTALPMPTNPGDDDDEPSTPRTTAATRRTERTSAMITVTAGHTNAPMDVPVQGAGQRIISSQALLGTITAMATLFALVLL